MSEGNALQVAGAKVRAFDPVALENLGREFPEVEHVVTRIGSPEVPTDVMGIELSDVFVNLKPRREWPGGRTKSELIDAMADALDERVPGMGFSFTQPIEMRFNEMLEGVDFV